MSAYICGPCAVAWHDKCSGFLLAQIGFCACSDRGHAAEGEAPVSLEMQLAQLAAAVLRKGPGRR
jgi:hypothetical protein